MKRFGQFYLDKEKDIIIQINEEDGNLTYCLQTPNHQSGNLITNLAKVCDLPISYNEEGYKIIVGDIPCYYDGEYRKVYILRLANTKVANIYPDGTIERKAYIPAIAKTLMSQTKDYNLDIQKTLVKTYIHEELKFHSDLHTHRSANLSPDLLIALGIKHQLAYPYYYVKKLGLRITDEQKEQLETMRIEVAKEYQDSKLVGKYKDRKIDDHTYINFADLILNNIKNSAYNIPKIRASLTVMKDGQAVFTNLEKVYLYRYVFTKGIVSSNQIEFNNIEEIPDVDIVNALKCMLEDQSNPDYTNNTLYQDKLLWIARSYQNRGIYYAEMSDTALVKRSEAASTLQEIHEIMPKIIQETGVVIRFLAAMRRIPLTIIKDQINTSNYFTENLQVLKSIVHDPYVAGSDFVGEEINDIRELKPVIQKILEIAKEEPSFVVRVHAGENDSLPDNVMNSVLCIEESLQEGQTFPHVRIGHGLYTANLKSKKGKELLRILMKREVVLEFQITSNVRLNNLSSLTHHPLKQYLNEGIMCVQGTDGCALYGSDSIDEQLSLERMLELNYDDIQKMVEAERKIIDYSLKEYQHKVDCFNALKCNDIQKYYEDKIQQNINDRMDLEEGVRRYNSEEVLASQIQELPVDAIPIVVAGGSYNYVGRYTHLRKEVCDGLDDLLARLDPRKVFFVIGPTIKGYERYLYTQGKDRFRFYAFVPTALTYKEVEVLKKSQIPIRISIESCMLGTYKSIAYEIFKRRQSIILGLDGNSAASNLIQDAKNSKYKSRTFINIYCKSLMSKAESLQGYVTILKDLTSNETVLEYADRYYDSLNDPARMLLKKKKV